MTSVAVIAHQNKTMDAGLGELRKILAQKGYPEPLWYEAPKSRGVPKLALQAIEDGAELIFVWGGDGTVQRCVDAVANSNVTLAILPAGTANLFATNLDIPKTIAEEVEVGLNGDDRRLDVGKLNGEHFAVMAGVGFDAVTMHFADKGLKDRLGRVAYVWTGARAARMSSRKFRVTVDNKVWFKGRASCVLLGQMSQLTDGVTAFPNSSPDDQLLDVGVVTAENALQWLRVMGRMVAGNAQSSPLTNMTQGKKIDIRINRSTRYELDGGARSKTRHLRAQIQPGAITVRVPKRETS